VKIRGLIWFADIVDKLETKHGVTQQEVREALNNKPRFRFIEKGHRAGKNVYSAMGRTTAGRLVVVFFIHKNDKRAMILSAREMESKEQKTNAKK
jgi:uncharacterized DUF497 family protein